jgi:hypothetical protein
MGEKEKRRGVSSKRMGNSNHPSGRRIHSVCACAWYKNAHLAVIIAAVKVNVAHWSVHRRRKRANLSPRIGRNVVKAHVIGLSKLVRRSAGNNVATRHGIGRRRSVSTGKGHVLSLDPLQLAGIKLVIGLDIARPFVFTNLTADKVEPRFTRRVSGGNVTHVIRLEWDTRQRIPFARIVQLVYPRVRVVHGVRVAGNRPFGPAGKDQGISVRIVRHRPAGAAFGQGREEFPLLAISRSYGMVVHETSIDMLSL